MLLLFLLSNLFKKYGINMMIEKVDVTIATKNNEDTIKKCIESIKENLPYNNIILIDDSSDRTPEIAKSLGAIVYHAPFLLGKKRYLQAKLSETEWIVSIDSDVFVFSNWWEDLSKEIRTNVIMINGFLESDFERIFPSYENFTKFCTINNIKKTGHGCTMGNNLIKRNALLNLKYELSNVHAGEDSLIGHKIDDSNFKWITVQKITGFHYHQDPMKHHLMAYYRQGSSIIQKEGIKGLIKIFSAFFNIQFSWILYTFHYRNIDIKLCKFLLSLYYEMIKGALNELRH